MHFVRLVLLFLIMAPGAVLAPKALAAAASRHPSIKVARELLSAKDRKAAVAELTAALANESRPLVRAEILKELRGAQEIFLFDAGQKAFEAGEIGRFSKMPYATARYEEALKLEGNNALVLVGLALLSLQKLDCDKATELVSGILANDPDYPAGRYLQTNAKICSGATKFTEEDLAVVRQLKEFRPAGLGVLAKGTHLLGDFKSTERYAREAIAMDPKYPTGYYWLFKIKSVDAEGGLVEAEKYIELCREITPESRRRYQWDADLCRDIEEAGKALRQAEGTSK